MSTIQVSNVVFESTGNNRVEYVGSNTTILYSGGVPAITATPTAVAVNTSITVSNLTVNTAFTAPNLSANSTQVNAFSLSVNSTAVAIPNTYALRVGTDAGTAGQVLASNGSAVYWANVASGGSGQFNTSLSNSVGFAANSTLSAAFTAPITAGLRYVVYSIHVTNIGGANTTINGEFSGTTYANVSFATLVPVPADSAVELLKMPKIMQPSDILRLGVGDNVALHATITYETQTDAKFFGVGVDITSDATYTDLYTASSGACVLQSLLLANDDGVNDVKARVVWTDGSNNIQGYYCYDLIVPADSTIEVLEQAKFLASGYKVRVYANVGNRLEAILAGKVI